MIILIKSTVVCVISEHYCPCDWHKNRRHQIKDSSPLRVTLPVSWNMSFIDIWSLPLCRRRYIKITLRAIKLTFPPPVDKRTFSLSRIHWPDFKDYVVCSRAKGFFSPCLYSQLSRGREAEHYRHLKWNNAYIMLWHWCCTGRPHVPLLSIG